MAEVSTTTAAEHLKEEVFANYDKKKHIVKNFNNITVKLGLNVISLKIEEENHILISDMWMRLKWIDADLSWKTEDFEGINVLRVNYDDIWKPDIVLYNRYLLKIGVCIVYQIYAI